MLSLTRKPNSETFLILADGGIVRIINNNRTKLHFDVPENVRVMRKEILEKHYHGDPRFCEATKNSRQDSLDRSLPENPETEI